VINGFYNVLIQGFHSYL